MGAAQNTLHASWASWLAHTFHPSTLRQRRWNSKFKGSLVYIASSRPARDTEKLSQNKTKQNTPQTHKTTPYPKSKSHIHTGYQRLKELYTVINGRAITSE